MKVKIPNCTLTEAQKGYIAGFLDGEGNLNIRKHPRSYNGKRYWTHSIRIVVVNTCPTPTDYMQRLLGGKRYVRQQHLGRGHQVSYALALNGAESQSLLKQILPYLIVKKDVAELMLKYPLNRGQSKDLYAKRETLYLRCLMISPNHQAKASVGKRPLAQTEREDNES